VAAAARGRVSGIDGGRGSIRMLTVLEKWRHAASARRSGSHPPVANRAPTFATVFLGANNRPDLEWKRFWESIRSLTLFTRIRQALLQAL
jgi:hypothetical protein